MLPFIIMYGLIFLLSFKVKKNYTIFDWIMLSVIIIFSAIRAVGTDYIQYKILYNYITETSVAVSRTGIGFAYLRIFFHNILHLDFQYLIAFISVITNLFIYIFIKNHTTHPGRAMLIYISLGFYSTSFNMFRQAFSIACVIFGLQKLEEKKYIKTLILYTLGYFIHSSSLIGIVCYTFFALKKDFKINLKIVFLISIVGLLLYNTVFYRIISYFPEYYIYITYNSKPGIGTILMVCVYLILYFVLFLPNRKEIIKSCNSTISFNLATIGIAIMLWELQNFLFFRIAYSFILFVPILLSEYYSVKSIKKNKLVSLLFYTCLFVFFLVYISSFDGVIPYKTFFN